MAGNVSGLHLFGPDTGPEALSLLDTNYGALTTALNTLSNFTNNYLDSGAVNALVVTVPAPQVFSYSDGIILQVKVAATSTISAPTINVNGLGLRTIVNPDGSALTTAQLVAGAWSTLQYNSTGGVFMLIGGSGFAVPKLVVGAPAAGTSLTINCLDGTNAVVLQGGAPTNGFQMRFVDTSSVRGLIGYGPDVVVGGALTDFGVIGNNALFLSANGGASKQVTLSNAGAVTLASPGSGIHVINNNGFATSMQLGFQASGTTAGYLIFQDITNSVLRGYVGFGSSLFTGAALTDFGIAGTAGTLRLSSDAGTHTQMAISGTTGATIQGLGPVAAALVDMTPDSSTFLGTFTGFGAGVTGTCTWSRLGKLVTLTFPLANGTSNATTFAMTGLPAAIQPSSLTQRVPLDSSSVEDNSAVLTLTNVSASASVGASGTVTFFKAGSASGWTNAGGKGFVTTTSISYQLN